MSAFRTFHHSSIVLFLLFTLSACSNHPPIEVAGDVNIKQFMGKWYVIASIPTFIEEGAHNAVESYAQNTDGSIATTFTFNQDGFDGEQRTYTPTGFVSEENAANWEMQFMWPFKSEYRIVHLDKDYTQTIIGRSARDYVWIMARQPHISDEAYQELINITAQKGYDTSKIIKVPHQWTDKL